MIVYDNISTFEPTWASNWVCIKDKNFKRILKKIQEMNGRFAVLQLYLTSERYPSNENNDSIIQ